MAIPPDEYTQRRPLFQHCAWVNDTLRGFDDRPDFDELYFERKGLNVKRFLEEAVPVAYLGLYFWRTWREITITCLADNGPYDAIIELQDPRYHHVINVEVTTVETDESTLRRQSLAHTGTAALTGPIWRDKATRRIHSRLIFVDAAAECERLLDLAYQRFVKKAEVECDPQTAILVFVDTHHRLFVRHRHHLVERTRHYLRSNNSTLYGVYYCYDPDLGIDGIRNNRDGLW